MKCKLRPRAEIWLRFVNFALPLAFVATVMFFILGFIAGMFWVDMQWPWVKYINAAILGVLAVVVAVRRMHRWLCEDSDS